MGPQAEEEAKLTRYQLNQCETYVSGIDQIEVSRQSGKQTLLKNISASLRIWGFFGRKWSSILVLLGFLRALSDLEHTTHH